MKIKTNYLVLLFLLIVTQVNAQDRKFTHQDTLYRNTRKHSQPDADHRLL